MICAAAGRGAAEFRPQLLLADITRDPLPRADAILCRDCLVHLSFANIAAAVDQFQRVRAANGWSRRRFRN